MVPHFWNISNIRLQAGERLKFLRLIITIPICPLQYYIVKSIILLLKVRIDRALILNRNYKFNSNRIVMIIFWIITDLLTAIVYTFRYAFVDS